MKKLFCSLVTFACFSATYAQLGINANGAAPIPSAQLDVESTTKALYPPRMTTAQKNAISGPQPGAVVYDTNLGVLSFYNGGVWVSATSTGSAATYAVGQNAQGGKVFWVDESGQHGLVMATIDQSASSVWYNGNTTTKAIRSGIYGGIFNTDQINQSIGYGSYAALSASTYTGGSFGDWYLPSYHELLVLRSSGQSGIASGTYWSSTEKIVNTGILADQAIAVDFTSGVGSELQKSALHKVRAIRKF
jgi:hypothetical protein